MYTNTEGERYYYCVFYYYSCAKWFVGGLLRVFFGVFFSGAVAKASFFYERF